MSSLILGIRLTLHSLEKVKINGIDLDDNVIKLRLEASKVTGLPENLLELVFCGLMLEDNRSMRSYGLRPGVTVHVLKRKEQNVPAVAKQMTDEEQRNLARAFRSIMRHPTHRNILARFSRPNILDNIISSTPGLREDPVALSILRDPDILENMQHMDTVKRVVERHPSLAEAASFIAATVQSEVAARKAAREVLARSATYLSMSSDSQSGASTSQARGSSSQSGASTSQARGSSSQSGASTSQARGSSSQSGASTSQARGSSSQSGASTSQARGSSSQSRVSSDQLGSSHGQSGGPRSQFAASSTQSRPPSSVLVARNSHSRSSVSQVEASHREMGPSHSRLRALGSRQGSSNSRSEASGRVQRVSATIVSSEAGSSEDVSMSESENMDNFSQANEGPGQQAGHFGIANSQMAAAVGQLGGAAGLRTGAVGQPTAATSVSASVGASFSMSTPPSTEATTVNTAMEAESALPSTSSGIFDNGGATGPNLLSRNLSYQLQQMWELGLVDTSVNMHALYITNGDVQAAVELIFSGALSQ